MGDFYISAPESLTIYKKMHPGRRVFLRISMSGMLRLQWDIALDVGRLYFKALSEAAGHAKQSRRWTRYEVRLLALAANFYF